jgi:Cu2+-containing amine oxidase
VIAVAQGSLLSFQEEANLLRLAEQQPESAGEFRQLLEVLASRVVEAALRDPRMVTRLEDVRHRVVGAEPCLEKPREEGGEIERLMEVGLYDYDRDQLVVPIVNLRSGSVIRIEERAGRQPPLIPEEVDEARGIVSSDPQP